MRNRFFLALLGATLFLGACSDPKTGYVDNVALYNQFELKQELEGRYLAYKQQTEKELDSIKVELKALATTLDNSEDKAPEQVREFNRIRQQFLERQNRIQQEEEELSNAYTEQVWEHLNTYLREYGEENEFAYILGGSGQGNIMYSSEQNDMTNELVDYVNKKYRGEG
ncbi:MAG: OmpH family outer membrane protein [Salibacteraceae bacterium]